MAKPGDFGLVNMGGTLGSLIELGQWLNGDSFDTYEHAFVVVDNGMIIEARPGGAQLITNYWPDDKTIYSSWSLTDAQRAAIVAAAMEKKGTPYSFLDYFSLVAHRFHIPVPGLKNYIANTGHEICSQLVDTVYQMAGLQIFQDHRWPGYVTPADLVAALKGPVK